MLTTNMYILTEKNRFVLEILRSFSIQKAAFAPYINKHCYI